MKAGVCAELSPLGDHGITLLILDTPAVVLSKMTVIQSHL